MTFEHDKWILVGFKGHEKVEWIVEKLGKTGEGAIRVAVFIPINESKQLSVLTSFLLFSDSFLLSFVPFFLLSSFLSFVQVTSFF